jgi:PAS domain S-box-containing protein
MLRNVSALLKRMWQLVPSGGALPEQVWRSRFRFLVGLTWFHAAVIALIGPVLGGNRELSLRAFVHDDYALHTVAEGSIVGLFALVASWRRLGRTIQATAVGFGLLSSSAILVHLSGGVIELHFHFFVMLAFLALCQDWIPYLLAVAFVALHHGVVGVLWPRAVYNHQSAYDHPWTWAGIHAGFVLCSCIGSVVAWRFNERAFAQTALILEATGEGIFGLDTDARLTFINPAAAGMLGVDARTAAGRPVADIVRCLELDGTPTPQERSPLLAPMQDGRARQGIDQIFGLPDGSYLPVDYVATPMIERNRLMGVVVSFNDITERHRAEAEVQRSHRQIEETLAELKATQRQVLQQERLRAMGEMASGIAHDFNNTLAPILGFAELLQRRPDMPTETAQHYVKLINTAARDAVSVIRRLRELYRDRGESSPDGALDLGRCIEEAAALTEPRWKSQAQSRGVTIKVVRDVAEVPVILGDPAAIREMLTNLIFNAVDAMPEGGRITMRARVDGDDVLLAVSDTGTGMPDDVRRRCLEPFFSTKDQHGTGLGLALVHATVQRHGGTLTVDSTPGLGTTFSVRLPIHRHAAAPAAPEPAEDPRRLRILVVEDDPLVRMTLTEQLSSRGHTVQGAANGLEALDTFMSGRFDLILTDRAMPEMSGDQLATTIKRIAASTPVIMLTGFGDLMTVRGEQPAAVDAVVSKPVTLDSLTQAIRQVFTPR